MERGYIDFPYSTAAGTGGTQRDARATKDGRTHRGDSVPDPGRGGHGNCLTHPAPVDSLPGNRSSRSNWIC